MLCNPWHYPTQSHTTSACFQKFILLSKITAMIKGHFRSTVLWAYLPPCTLFESQLSIKPFFFSPTLICLIWKKKKKRCFVSLCVSDESPNHDEARYSQHTPPPTEASSGAGGAVMIGPSGSGQASNCLSHETQLKMRLLIATLINIT